MSKNWENNLINVMPVGLFSIANYANEHGHHVKVMNAAVYGNYKKAKKIIFNRIKANKFSVVGLSIHWHKTAYEVIRFADEIKKTFPNCNIVAGGITASVYAQEFLKRSKGLDAIVQGDGEVPFLRYLDELSKRPDKQDLSSVPNLHWKKERKYFFNGLNYTATAKELSGFDYGIRTSLYDKKEYADSFASKNPIRMKYFNFTIGRGCNLNCIYCAGSRISSKKFFNRNGVTIRSVDSVFKTIKDAYNCGFRMFYTGFAPPFPKKDHYFSRLFSRIRKELPKKVIFGIECYELPSDKFIKLCSQSFKGVELTLSPCFFNSQNMKKYNGYFYTRQDLERTLSVISKYPNILAYVYYSTSGIEPYNKKELGKNSRMLRTLLEKINNCYINIQPINAEPGSPWVSFHDLFNKHNFKLTFNDFWRMWKNKDYKKLYHSKNSPLLYCKDINKKLERHTLDLEWFSAD